MNVKKGVLIVSIKKNFLLVSFFHGLKRQHSVSATAIKFGSCEMYVLLEKFDSGNSSWSLHSAVVQFLSMVFIFRKSVQKDSNRRIYGYLYIKTKMGVAGLIFEPHPPNFENQYNFWRCSNDAKMIFWFLYWFQIFKDQFGVFRPYL